MSTPEPSIPRVAWAFIIAPGLTALAVAAAFATIAGRAEMMLLTWAVAAVVSYGCALLLGLPAYYFLKAWVRRRFIPTVAVASLVGGGGILLWRLLAAALHTWALGDEAALAALLTAVYVLAGLVLGAVGGAVFWTVAYFGKSPGARAAPTP